MKQTARAPRDIGWIAVGSFLLAFAVRLLWVFAVQSPFRAVYSDMQGYVDRAEHLLWHLPVDDPRLLTLYPPGAHAILALEFFLFGRHAETTISIVHALVAAIPAACVPSLMYRLVPSRGAAASAGILVALWQPQIWCVGFFTTEIWFSAAIALHAALTSRGVARATGLLATGLAAVTAIVVRPQFLLTWVMDTSARLGLQWRRRGLRAAVIAAVWLSLPVAVGLCATSYRYHSLTGRWGLISTSGLNRIWASTDVCKVVASWDLPNGGRVTWWFSPPSKPAIKPSDTVTLEGFIADPDLLDGIVRERTLGVPLRDRLRRRLHNVDLLLRGNLPWPEGNEDGRSLWPGGPQRRWLQELFRNLVLFAVLPWCCIGVVLARPNRTKRVLVANLVTVVVAAALFFGEARYHVPYDPFAIVLGVAGLYEASALIRRRAALEWPSFGGVGAQEAEAYPGAAGASHRNLVRAAVAVAALSLITTAAVAAYGVRALQPVRGTAATSPATEHEGAAAWHYGKTQAEVRALLGSDKRIVSIAVSSASPLRLDVQVTDNTGVGEVKWWWIPDGGPDVPGDGVGRFAGSHEARLVSLAPYVLEGQTYFAGVYISGGGPDDHGWWYYFDQPRAAIDGLLAKHGARLADLRSYSKGATLYSLILVPRAATDGWWWDTGLDGRTVREQLHAHGATLTSLSPTDPSTSTFDVVMTSTPFRSMPTYDNVSWAWATQEAD